MTWEASGALAAAIVAAIALIFAVRSNGIAKEANKIAAGARNEAAEANRLSGESNTIATAANEIAEAANAIASEQQKLSKERDDVDWIGEWPKAGVYHLRNRGRDTAHNVHATVWVNGDEQVREKEEVREDDHIEFVFQAAANQRSRKLAERKRAARQSPYGLLAPDLGETLAHRVTWETQMGRHRLWEPNGQIGEDLGLPDE